MRTLEKMELGLYFHIGTQALDPDRDDEPEYAVLRTAYESIVEKLWDVPGIIIMFDYHGSETQVQTPETSRQLRVELCELGVESETVNERLAYGFHFVSSRDIDLPLAQALKSFCESELAAAGAAAGLPTSFAKAQVFKEWRDTEKYDWAGV